MATILSSPTTVTVQSSGPSALSALAASMAPGSWAKLSVSNQNSILGVGSISGSMIHFCNSMPWNPIANAIEIIGMDHNWGSERYVRYSEATNQFVLMSGDLGWGSMTQHGYDHSVVNPNNGDLYHRVYSGFTGTISSRRKPNSSATTFTNLPNVTGQTEQVAIGACWWSGTFNGGGAQGSFMIFNSGNSLGNANDGHIIAYDPLTNAWFFNRTGMAPFYGTNATYHSLIEYSAKKNVAVYGGGNAAPNKLWRLNADASFTVMPNVPSGKGVGIQQGVLIDDPVTGNFLLLSAGELWELNPSGTGTWTQQTGARVPPAGVGNPKAPDGVIASSIPEYGVVAFITQSSQTGGTFFLYKHA